MKLFKIIIFTAISLCVSANAAKIFTLNTTNSGNDLVLTLRQNLTITLTQPTQFSFIGFRLTDVFASTGGQGAQPAGDFSVANSGLFGISTPSAQESYENFTEGSNLNAADSLDLVGVFGLRDGAGDRNQNLNAGDVVTLLAGSVVLTGGANGINTDLDFDPSLGIPNDTFAELTLITISPSGNDLNTVDISNTIVVDVIPEPSTAILGFLGTLSLIVRRKR